MIVKNEAPVIRRCLDSVRPIIDYWVIVDTGSSDGTQQLIRDHLEGLSGELHERPWRDFAHNRSEALTLARAHGDYSLIIDADDSLEIPADFQLPDLQADAYLLDIHDAGSRYQRLQLVRNALPWRYRGVLHEFLDCPGSRPPGHLDIVMHRNHDGARRRDPQTYHKDAAILERALATETDAFLRTRYTFYLAQSYRDAGALPAAIDAYLRRADMGGWDQEVYYSLYQAARAKMMLGQHAPDEVIDLCLRASQLVPGRAEALHCASQLCRTMGRSPQGYEIARRGLDLRPPNDGLFVETWIYDYGLLDEYAINAYWAGHYHESLDACLKLQTAPGFPADQHARLAANARFAFDRLPRAPEQASYTPLTHPPGQHRLGSARELHPAQLNGASSKVLLAILLGDHEPLLPLYLQCIEALDYPKTSLIVYIAGQCSEHARELLDAWTARVGAQYAAIEIADHSLGDTSESAQGNTLARLRERSLRKTVEHHCDYYFAADTNHFLHPCTLRELVALSLPIVAPLLRSADAESRYANFHADIDGKGYFQECQQYDWILSQAITGVLELPVVNGACLIRADMIDGLSYQDGSTRHAYVVFSESARRLGIPQYLDNRQLYGYLVLDGGVDRAAEVARLLGIHQP
jgi:hypothetical protein